jgi:hypothetical protein
MGHFLRDGTYQLTGTEDDPESDQDGGRSRDEWMGIKRPVEPGQIADELSLEQRLNNLETRMIQAEALIERIEKP